MTFRVVAPRVVNVGEPVQLLKTPAVGVPNAGVTSVMLVHIPVGV